MKRTVVESPLDKGINPAIDFIRDNELSVEMGGDMMITSKGEQLLSELQGDSPK
jgi:hypothetical protein